MVVFEASHQKKDGKKDSDRSGRVSTRNVIDTRKKWKVILRRRQIKTSKR
jgi:hypothetical protein